ncbi:uncharacterized protein [Amphiura filiformis]|uniref:uncharacterized protein n=1 Tax=Amphiura filiformis TaxID=82378 RepID=UPI003B2108AB
MIGYPWPLVGYDCNGHGTHAAGLAAGSTYGIATNAILHSVRVFGCIGFTPDSLIITTLEWIAENAVRPAVLSMSFDTSFSQAMYDTAESLVKEGFVLSVAAGNENQDACERTPAAAPSVITVAASDREDAKLPISNIGRCVDIIAPGMDIISAINADYGATIRSGTSFSCPLVSGAAAVLLGIDSTLTPEEVSDLLCRGASLNKISNARFLTPNRLLYIGKETCMTRCGSTTDDDFTCQCDPECSSRGDCCSDYSYLCWENAPTCDSRCYDTTDEATYPCQCDESCVARHDCCQDYYLLCRPHVPCDYTTPYPGKGSYYSPYYPDNYLNNQTCRTLLVSDDDSFQTIMAFEGFNLQESANCTADSLSIYDGDSEKSPLIGKYCGTDIPRFVTSTGPNATLIFDTDSSETNAGYSLKAVFGTVRTINARAPGSITSVSFPYSYPGREIVITTITSGNKEHIAISFEFFEVQDIPFEDDCYDYLEFFDGETPTKKAFIGRACGTQKSFSPLKSTGQALVLVFFADQRFDESRGYDATLTTVKSCDSIVTSTGTISSSNYPSQYYNNEQCSTKIRAKRGKRVLLTFTDVNLEERSNEGSCYDKLQVYDGGVAKAGALIGEFCGSELPVFRSSGRKLLIVFSSDFMINGKGYTAAVTFVTATKAVLVGGNSRNEGRVEIIHPQYGRGTVCDNQWDIKDASIVCKMLGYGAAREAPTKAYFGQGNIQVLLNDVDCSGMELNIEECQHSGWRQNYCYHREDAGAVCYQKGEIPLPIRLVDGNLPTDGRIEVLIGEQWGTICDDDWDLQDAQVVCSSLGYSGAARALTKGSVTPGNTSLPIYFDNVACDGDEAGLEFCRHHGVGNHDCDHSKDAGVECISDDESRSRQAREVEKMETTKEDVEWMMELVDLNIDWN